MMDKDLQEALDWDSISCPQFEGMLSYNTKTKEYRHMGKTVSENDIRLIEFKNMSRNLVPYESH